MDNKATSYTNKRWMSATPAIDRLSLKELTLPGTHNAGCDRKAEYAFVPGAHWLACQHDSFYAQLNHGARSLDIRLILDHKASGADKFRCHHNGYLTSRTLNDVMSDITYFLRENPDEFIMLHFQHLRSTGQSFDYKLFNEIMIKGAENLLIPLGNGHLSLGELKKASATQRVYAAVPYHSDLDKNLFHSEVNGRWSGISATSVAELQKFITEEMDSPPGRWEPWSLSATSFTALGGPVDIHEYLNNWFDPEKSDWAQKCNIISVDFMEETNLVSYCRTACLRNAANKV